MKKITNSLIAVLILSGTFLYSETLFEVKDSSNNKVLDVSTDGLRIMNLEDTLMVISPSGVRVNLNNSATKGLSRSFSVSTTTSKGKGLTNVMEVGTQSTTMREGDLGQRYTNFSPDNLFLGLQAGINTDINYTYSWGINNVFMGNYAGVLNEIGSDNIFMGFNAGNKNIHASDNIFIGSYAGYNTDSDDLPPFGSMNIFVGTRSGYSNLDGYDNVCIGNEAGEAFTGSSQNVFVGGYAGNASTTGANALVGSLAMYRNTTGNHNVVLGAETGYNNLTGSGNVFLGYQSGYNETGSNKLYISNSNTSTPLIKGTFPNTDLAFTSSLVSVIHPLGETTNGLKIQSSYNLNTDSWHFYQQTDDELGLYYNTGLRGSYNITTGAYTSVSDRKLKKNIENLNNLSDRVLKLQPVSYNFISQKDEEKKYLGLIAQDVEKLFPEFVNYNEESDTYTLDYAGLSVVAIQAIKEQQKRIERLEELVQKLLDK